MSEINIKDIAKIAGVSYSSVSRAINGKPGISEETRKKILDICAKEGYLQNSLARSMVLKRTNIMGLLVPDISNPFYSELTLKFDALFREAGYNIMLFNTHGDDRLTGELYQYLSQYKPDGIIVVAPSDHVYPIFCHSSCPVIYIADTDGIYPGDFITTDNYFGGHLAIEYLYNLGHRDIIYFGYHAGSSAHAHRYHGSQDAAKDLGVRLQRFDSEFSYSCVENGYSMAKKFFAQKLHYTAVFATSDTMALGMLQAADELGIQVPRNFSLLGFDNIITSGLPRIMLTTIEQQKKSIVEAVMDLMMKRIHHPENAACTYQIFRPEVIERSSCIRI